MARCQSLLEAECGDRCLVFVPLSPPQYCVMLTVGPAICLLQSKPAAGGLHTTTCSWTPLPAGGVGKVSFTLMGLEPGEHTLTFTLRTREGSRDVLEKKLRVVVRKWMMDTRGSNKLSVCLIHADVSV